MSIGSQRHSDVATFIAQLLLKECATIERMCDNERGLLRSVGNSTLA